MQRKPLRCASATASSVSVSVPIWLTLTSSALAAPLVDAALQPLRVGDEEVVADDLDLVAERGGERLPAVPVVLGQRVLDARRAGSPRRARRSRRSSPRRTAACPRRCSRRRRRTRSRRRPAPARCRRRAVKPACSIASTIRSSAARLLGRSGAKPPSSPRPVDEALLLEHRLERVVDLRAPAQRLGEGGRADRRDHELLDVDVVVGVRAAVEDVHHRDGQHVRVRAAEVAEQRQVGRVGGGPGDRERDAEDGVGAEPGLVRACRRGRSAPGRRAAARSASKPSSSGPISSRTASDGLLDALAAVALASPSRSSTASKARWRRRWAPPPGRCVPSSSATSTSTVGLPRESRISRAPTASMVATGVLRFKVEGVRYWLEAGAARLPGRGSTARRPPRPRARLGATLVHAHAPPHAQHPSDLAPRPRRAAPRVAHSRMITCGGQGGGRSAARWRRRSGERPRGARPRRRARPREPGPRRRAAGRRPPRSERRWRAARRRRRRGRAGRPARRADISLAASESAGWASGRRRPRRSGPSRPRFRVSQPASTSAAVLRATPRRTRAGAGGRAWRRCPRATSSTPRGRCGCSAAIRAWKTTCSSTSPSSSRSAARSPVSMASTVS